MILSVVGQDTENTHISVLVEAGPPTGYQQPTTTTTTTTVVGAEVAFVVESIVRSQGSLSEITIHEGQQFIGEEVAAGAGGAEAAAAEPQSSGAGHHGSVSVSLFGGAVRGSLFEDEYSSDYFCGVREKLHVEACLSALLSHGGRLTASSRPVPQLLYLSNLKTSRRARTDVLGLISFDEVQNTGKTQHSSSGSGIVFCLDDTECRFVEIPTEMTAYGTHTSRPSR